VLQVAKIVNRNKGALTYSYRQCLPLQEMGVYLFQSACKYEYILLQPVSAVFVASQHSQLWVTKLVLVHK